MDVIVNSEQQQDELQKGGGGERLDETRRESGGAVASSSSSRDGNGCSFLGNFFTSKMGTNNERGAAKLARHAGPVVHSRGERESR
jgi:hypothetical protein